MKEIELKLEELNQDLGAVKSIIKDIKKDIKEFKEQNKSYIGAERTLNEFKEKEKDIEKKISILNDAQDILLGIGI